MAKCRQSTFYARFINVPEAEESYRAHLYQGFFEVISDCYFRACRAPLHAWSSQDTTAAPLQADSSVLRFCSADPFAEQVEKEDSGAGKDYVHIRIQQRNGKKSLTTIQVDLTVDSRCL